MVYTNKTMSEEVKEEELTPQQDFEERSKKATDEINAITEKYEIGIDAQIQWTPAGAIPKVVFVNIKK